MSDKRSERERELRAAVEFVDRLTVLKTARGHGIFGYGGGLARRPREHFLDYCERVRAAFPAKHKMPNARLRKGGAR